MACRRYSSFAGWRTPSHPLDRFCLLLAAPRKRALAANREGRDPIDKRYRQQISWAGVAIQRSDVDADALSIELLDRVYDHAKALADA